MKLIVGLGNPGERYRKTRHNVGFRFVDSFLVQILNLKSEFVEKAQPSNHKLDRVLQSEFYILSLKKAKNSQIVLAKPQTFMNSSGLAVKELLSHFKIKLPDLWVIHDDLDLKLGDYKIQFGVGPKLHYGVLSIEKELKTKNFWRVRIGVDNRDPVNKIEGERYVLKNFRADEEARLRKVIDKIADELMDRLLGRG